MNHPLYDKAFADFAAGAKDQALYNDFEKGLEYRNGWRAARLQAEQTPEAALPPSSPTLTVSQAVAPAKQPVSAKIRANEALHAMLDDPKVKKAAEKVLEAACSDPQLDLFHLPSLQNRPEIERA